MILFLGPPAPPTRTDSRAKDWKARYGSLPRSGSGSVNGDAPDVQMRVSEVNQLNYNKNWNADSKV